MSNLIIKRIPGITKTLFEKNLPILVNQTAAASCYSEDVETHTGQKWDADDYRLSRFIHASKQVNNSWAINLINEIPPKEVTDRVVWCDGGSGPEGHPKVYINLDKPGNHACGYCGLRFVKKDHHK